MTRDFGAFQDTKSARHYFWRRLYEYGACNFQFSLYYDKIFKKEYLPSRIRYNQFFFYAILGYWIWTYKSHYWSFTNELETDLGQRKYYTLGRPIQNFIARSNDQSRLKAHVQTQKYIL